jgi:Flp pilus assembly protein TadG
MERRKAVRSVNKWSSESGTQLVEFALVAPVFTLLLFAFAQYGLLFSSYLAVRNASTVGGRQAIISPGNTNAIMSVATAAAGAMLVDTNHVTVNVGTVTLSTGIGTSVTVSYPVKLVVPFVVPPFTTTARTRTVTAVTIVQ